MSETRQFVGLASYYRRFIPNFAKIAHPLHALTRKGAPFRWTNEFQEAFTTLKQMLSSGPVLAYPDFCKEFVLETDASIRGLGAVLSQKQTDGKLHLIAFASRALSTRKELCCDRAGNPCSSVGLQPLPCVSVWTQCDRVH